MTAKEILDDIESCYDEKQQIGLLHTYARLQIEKDRERVINSDIIIQECGTAIDMKLKDRTSCGHWCGGCDSVVTSLDVDLIRSLPITLD